MPTSFLLLFEYWEKEAFEHIKWEKCLPIPKETPADVLRDLYTDAKSAKLQFMHNYEDRIIKALARDRAELTKGSEK